MIGFYDGQNYFQYNSIDEFFKKVLSRRYRGFKIFGHYAGKYDDLFLLDHAGKLGDKFNYSTICQGSKILSLKFKRGKNSWSFVDSSGLFPNMSLDKLTKSFDVKNKKMTGTIDFKTERVDKNNSLHQEYLKNDVMGLYQVIQKFLENEKIAEEGFNLTIASQAMGMWRRTLKKSIKVTPQGIQDFIRGSYFGGRTEIYKMRGAKLNYYDVNSLYPFVMRTMRLPLQHECYTRELTDALSFLDVDVKVPDTYIPILPVKSDGKLIFPSGTFRGVFYSEELKLALSQGAKILKVYRGEQFTDAHDLFSEYIDYFYAQKENAEKGSARELIAKLLLNSLYGKYGQREEREILKQHESETDFTPFHSHEVFDITRLIQVTKYIRAPSMLVHIAAAITAGARITMANKAFIKFPEHCFYTDTDSIFTTKELETGTKMGEFKLEHSKLNGIFKQPKAYYLENSSGFKEIKIKGFSKDFTKNISKKDFNAGNFNETKIIPCTLKTSLIRNKCYLSKVEVTKEMRSEYTKRRILKNHDTEAWVIKNGVILNSR